MMSLEEQERVREGKGIEQWLEFVDYLDPRKIEIPIAAIAVVMMVTCYLQSLWR